ncbi:MAG: DUF2169 domain-containing protein [Deltaproteobacteria bacterium]|nr:DUF2169 domain-containing protein [Deltaproteobacteria bacterium]
MELICVSPPRAGHLVWQRRPDDWVLTVFCKVTYELVPGEARLARKQQEPNLIDRHWDEDSGRSVYAPCDVGPRKPRADVVLVGTAYAPNATPTQTLTVRLTLAGIDKCMEIWGARALDQDGTVHPGEPFATMPLRWEHAAGGPSTRNPAGMPLAARDAYGRFLLPHFQPPETQIQADNLHIEPIGLFPIPGSWPDRSERLGPLAATWSSSGWQDQPLPEGFDLGYFNVAPADQQVPALHDNEGIVLEHLHRDHPKLVTQLPGVRPAVFVDDGQRQDRLDVTPDTLWIDTSESVCTLTFRGERALSGRDAPGRIVVGMESGSETLGWDDVERMLPGSSPRASKPSAARPRRKDPGTMLAAAIPGIPGALPFAGGQGARTPVPGERPSNPGEGLPFSTHTPAIGAGPGSSAQPWPEPSPSSPAASGTPAPVTPAPPAQDSAVSYVPAPHSVPTPQAASPSSPGPASVSSPWAGQVDRPSTPGPTGTPAVAHADARALGEYAAKVAAGPAPAPVKTPAASVPTLEPEAPPSDPLLLLWFDPECLPRVRRLDRFRPVLEALDHRPVDRELDDAVPSDDPFELEDRRELFEVLARGKPDSSSGVRRAVERAMRKDGKYVPQMVLLAGHLVTPFDELSRLKATLTTVQPLMREEDEDLKSAVDHTRDFLAMPDLICPPSVLNGFTKRIHDEFDAEDLSLVETYLKDETDRILLDQRLYQKRILYGAPHLRTLLELTGEDTPIPTYLPEDIAGELPLFQRFKVRLLAEARLQEDENEPCEVALRLLALARVVPRPYGLDDSAHQA